MAMRENSARRGELWGTTNLLDFTQIKIVTTPDKPLRESSLFTLRELCED